MHYPLGTALQLSVETTVDKTSLPHPQSLFLRMLCTSYCAVIVSLRRIIFFRAPASPHGIGGGGAGYTLSTGPTLLPCAWGYGNFAGRWVSPWPFMRIGRQSYIGKVRRSAFFFLSHGPSGNINNNNNNNNNSNNNSTRGFGLFFLPPRLV